MSDAHAEWSLPVNRIDEMACKELVEIVTEYLEGTLDEADRLRLEVHLEECPGCVEYVDQFRETILATGEVMLSSLAPERRAELLEAFRGWRAHPNGSSARSAL
jgi:anti-sigma factor RsiW